MITKDEIDAIKNLYERRRALNKYHRWLEEERAKARTKDSNERTRDYFKKHCAIFKEKRKAEAAAKRANLRCKSCGDSVPAPRTKYCSEWCSKLVSAQRAKNEYQRKKRER